MKMVVGKRKRVVKRICVPPLPFYQEEEEEEEEGQYVYVKVKREDGEQKVISYKIDRNLPLRWLMFSYCTSVCLDYQTTRFFFNGARLRETDTPLQVSILESDFISVFPHHFPLPVPTPGAVGRFVTVCIRIHNAKAEFLRLQSTLPILRQFKRCLLSEDVPVKEPWNLCFVYNEVKLTEDHTAQQLNMEDGDIIDGFNFDDRRALSVIWYPTVTVKVENQMGKEYVFTLSTDTPLIKMLNKYCKLESIEDTRYVSLYRKGVALRLRKTAKEAKLEDGDLIDAMLRQGAPRID